MHMARSFEGTQANSVCSASRSSIWSPSDKQGLELTEKTTSLPNHLEQADHPRLDEVFVPVNNPAVRGM